MLPTLYLALVAAAQPVDTRFAQVAPYTIGSDAVRRSPGETRAVILIHGLHIRPLGKDGIVRASFSDWQKTDSLLVKQLSSQADVFAFAYAQTTAADDIADAPDLGAAVRRVRARGYREVVLVGYSAGGLIAREFVEDDPDAGVTKVIQVCAPNAGSSWAYWNAPLFTRRQVDFLHSLTKEGRRKIMGARADKEIPPGIEFACIVGTGIPGGDGLVQTRSQWSEDLQRQGVPAVAVAVTHWHVLHSKAGVKAVVDLVTQPTPRWSAAQVLDERRRLFGKP